MDLDTLHLQWTEATAKLAYGEQRVFKDVLTLVSEEKKTNLVWGSDYWGSSGACLVNAAGSMLSKGDGSGVPMQQFGEVVALYDQLNREYLNRGINSTQHVSPLAADVMLQYFAPLKEAPAETLARETHFADDQNYVEPTDEAMLSDLLKLLSDNDLPVGEEVQTPFDTHNENV